MSQLLTNYLLIFVVVCVQGIFVSCGNADVYWRDYRGTIPRDAVPTDHGTYIAQVIIENGGIVPGTLYPDRKVAVSEAPSGRVEFLNNIKILCSPQPSALKWEYVNTNQLDAKFLEKCIVGGFEVGHTLYIGKVFHQGQWKIGKVFPPHAEHTGLRVWWNDGNNYAPQDFQILMER
ncbi:uncharacterized protein [Onthophagus taurus]|uniref:uncharacterized protein n=1 Tax=Onthophagus taurus TaxID=166361 RepID=UPI000C1FF127|nr:uncharacterized protein LOC111418330 [Onthophagus taurus]